MRQERPLIDGPGGPLPCYLAAPSGWPPGPAVVVVQEWWGLNDHIRDICGRLASEGFAALAPDLYRGRLTEEPDEARKMAMELDRPTALADLGACVGWLLDQGASAVGAIGFCMGGSLAFDLAAEDERLGACVPFYGLADVRDRGLKAPVLAHFGTADRYPPDVLEDVRQMIQAGPHGGDVHLYEDAPHAFFNDTEESYRPQAAGLAWERTLAFLRAHLEQR